MSQKHNLWYWHPYFFSFLVVLISNNDTERWTYTPSLTLLSTMLEQWCNAKKQVLTR